MIAIDANMLLHQWLNDNPAPSKRIDRLLAEHGGLSGSLLVTDIVLVEAVWTLKSAFEQDKHAQSIAVRNLIEETAFGADHPGFTDMVARAKYDARAPVKGKSKEEAMREFIDLIERA